MLVSEPHRVFLTVTPPTSLSPSPGLSDQSCSGVCPPGYFCPPGTVEALTHKCGSLFLNSTNQDFLANGDAINGGFAGAGAIAGIAAGDNPNYIAWEAGVRVRRPTQSQRIESIVSIHSFQLDGGPSSVYCPEGSDFPIAVTSGCVSVAWSAVCGERGVLTRATTLG